MPDREHSVLRKQKQAQAQNLLREYSGLILEAVEEVKKELGTEITGNSTDEIALEYKRRQGGREALNNFLARLNGKANERV